LPYPTSIDLYSTFFRFDTRPLRVIERPISPESLWNALAPYGVLYGTMRKSQQKLPPMIPILPCFHALSTILAYSSDSTLIASLSLFFGMLPSHLHFISSSIIVSQIPHTHSPHHVHFISIAQTRRRLLYTNFFVVLTLSPFRRKEALVSAIACLSANSIPLWGGRNFLPER
jgi:hypothetical protein